MKDSRPPLTSVALAIRRALDYGLPVLLATASGDCTADALDTLRDQIACVDARVAASPARMEFDDLAHRILGEVDNGSTNETDARREIYTTLSQRAAPSQP